MPHRDADLRRVRDAPRLHGTPQGPFGFAATSGYQEDGDSGLKLLGHRYYDPSTGRFLTRDPAKDGRNWYAYCGNNPLKKVDATSFTWKWLESAVDWVVDKVEGGLKGVATGVGTVFGTATTIGLIASFGESLYAGAIGGNERLKMDRIYDQAIANGLDPATGERLKHQNDKESLGDGLNVISRYWQAQQDFW